MRKTVYYDRTNFASIMRAINEKYGIKHPELVDLRRHIIAVYNERDTESEWDLPGIARQVLFMLKDGKKVKTLLETPAKVLFDEINS